MKANKKISTLMAATMLASSTVVVNAATTDIATLIGKNRIETAIKISKDGWSSAETVVLVNSSAIPDALTATPLAHAKKAPILLTDKDGLNKATANEIKRLGAKNVIMIGGDAVLSSKVEKDLKAMKLNIDRVKGNTREETALAIAKRLDGIKDISEIAVVNGTTGLVDAVSIAAAAAEKGMPIILANPKNGLSVSEKFIKAESIKSSFIIGGKTVLPEKLVSSIPGKDRIEGTNRRDTNAKVIEKFYGNRNLDNLYLAKDGMGDSGQLIDALAVGALAAKNGAPVLIASKKLSEKQIEVINTKRIDTITQVGGNGNEKAFGELKEIEKEVVIKVKSESELQEALDKANANDIIEIEEGVKISNDMTLSTNNAIQIYVKGELKGEVTVNTPNADIKNSGNIGTLVVENGKNTTVTNSYSGKIDKVEIDSSSENVKVENNGTITQIENNAKGTEIENYGTISKPIIGTTTPEVDGNKPGGGSSGGSSLGGTVVTPSVSSVTASVYRNDISVSADVSYAGSNKATVELFDKDGNSVVKKENIDVINGKVESKFESIAEGEYTVKVTVGSSSKVSGKLSISNKIIKISVDDENVLKDAFKNASNGDTIYLESDVNLSSTLEVPKSLTIDLNNRKLIQNGKNYEEKVLLIAKDGLNVDIRNGEITNRDNRQSGRYAGIVVNANDVTVNIDKVDIKMAGYEVWDSNINGVYANGNFENVTFNINKCYISGVAAGVFFPVKGVGDKAGKLNIKDTTIENVKLGVVVKGGVVNIKDTNIVSSGLANGSYSNGKKKTVDETIFSASPSNSGYASCGEALLIECNYPNRVIDVTVDGSCDFTGKNGYAVRMQFFKGDIEKKLTINSGNFIGRIGGIFELHEKNTTGYGASDAKLVKDGAIKINGGYFSHHVKEIINENNESQIVEK